MARRKQTEVEGAFFSGVEEMPDEEPASDDEVVDGMRVSFDGEGNPEVELVDEEGAKEPTSKEFDDNLADELSESEQVTLGMKLKEYVELDIQSRAVWEQRMLDGLEIIGLEDVPDDAVAFEGAARVNYPGIAEAMVQFQARAMDELMPPEGPVKCGVIGKSSDELEAQAERVQDYMNYQLMEEDDEYYSETDDLLLYLPYAGSAFRKVAIDPVTGRTRSRFVPASDFIVPYWAKSLKTAPRYTHRYSMPLNVYKRAVAGGFFVDADFGAQVTSTPSGTTSTKLADTSDDKTPAHHEDDRDLQFYEMTIDFDFEWETHGKNLGYSLPYVITFEWETGRVVRIARCWDEEDETCQKDVWFTHYKFLPGLGFYGWGYLHLIGGLGRAASGALRLLLDGSATASLQGGFKSRDARIAGDVSFSPAVWQDVDMTAEELAKSFYSPPFKEPSPALFKTLEILINGVQRFASTTEAMVGDATNTGPVGTTVALIEQGSKIFSGIHKRIHAAMRRELKMIALSNYRYMDMDEYPFDVAGGDRRIMREDFSPKVDIIPVSDPNIFSSVQRIAIAQAGVQLVDQRPDLYPREAQIRAHRAMWKALRVPDADKYLPEKQVKRLDPVSENVAMLSGIGVQVFPEQDDASHMAVHAIMEQEAMALPPDIQQKLIPALHAHMAAHFASMHRKRIEASVMQATGVPLPPFDPNNYEDNEELPPDIEAAVARAAAQYAPPPPAPAPQQDPEAAKDEAAVRKADRDDMLAQRKAERDDMVRMAELKRDGLISDVDEPAEPPMI
jgi:chaperonin GroES